MGVYENRGPQCRSPKSTISSGHWCVQAKTCRKARIRTGFQKVRWQSFCRNELFWYPLQGSYSAKECQDPPSWYSHYNPKLCPPRSSPKRGPFAGRWAATWQWKSQGCRVFKAWAAILQSHRRLIRLWCCRVHAET